MSRIATEGECKRDNSDPPSRTRVLSASVPPYPLDENLALPSDDSSSRRLGVLTGGRGQVRSVVELHHERAVLVGYQRGQDVPL